MFKSIFLGDGTKAPAGKEKTCRRLHGLWIYVMLVIMGVCIGLVSMFVCSSYLGNEGWEMYDSYMAKPLIAVLNILPCVLLILLLYFATGRAWIAYSGTSLLIFLMSLINYYKVRLRNDVFVPADLGYFSEAANMTSRYPIEFTGRTILPIVAFVFGTVFAVLFLRGKLKGWRTRVIGSVAVLAVCALLYSTVYTSDRVYEVETDNSESGINIWSEFQVYVSKGFLYPFIHAVPKALHVPPDGYNKKEAAELLARYSDSDIPDDKKVNIISIMLESYADLSTLGVLDFEQDVYGPFHELQAESWSGTLSDNIFAGGTIDTERSFLTGYPHCEDYAAKVNSYVWYLRSQGYVTEGYHAGDAWFYNRQNINEYMGLERYLFLDDFEGSSRLDADFFMRVRDMYDARDKSVPYFSYSLTYQNHGAYESETTVDTAYISSEGMSHESYCILNNYLSGIYDTTYRISSFVDGFRDDPEPVVLVIFGDHMPWLGNMDSVYKELGITLDLGTEEGFYNYYSTPYIIWANAAARETLGNDFTGDGGNFSPCFLMQELFDLCGWEGSAWMKASRDVREYTSIINIPTGYVRIDGRLTREPPEAAEKAIAEYEYMEYYTKRHMVYGK